jgi:hypothetical protein
MSTIGINVFSSLYKSNYFVEKKLIECTVLLFDQAAMAIAPATFSQPVAPRRICSEPGWCPDGARNL